jgi:hypothetical protein
MSILPGEKARVAEDDLSTVDGGDRALPGDVSERGRGATGDVAGVGVIHDRFRQRMLGFPLQRDREGESLEVVAADGDVVGDLRLPLGEGAGLVEHDRVDVGGGFDPGGVLEQHAPFRAEPGADHDRRRGREAERVGAGDDDDGDSEQDRHRDCSAGEQPHQEGEGAADQGDQDEPERCPVGEALPGGFGVLRLLHELHDLRQRRVRADFGGCDAEGADGVHGRSDHLRPGRFVHRHGLAGDHRLVHLGLSGFHDTVGGDLRPRPHQHQIPRDDLAGGDLDLLPVTDHDRLRGCELQEGADGVVRAAAGAHLHPMPQQHEGGKHRGGFVEHFTAAGEGDREGVQPAGADTDCDEHHHVEGLARSAR